MKERLWRGWPCFASAFLLFLAFLPLRLEFLAFAALAPWFASLRDTTRRGAWKSGYCFGFFFGLGQLYWLGVLTQRWTGSWLLMVFPWLVACLLFALYFGWVGIQIWKCWQRGVPLLVPVIWVGIEVFRSYIPVFAFPYALIATPFWHDAPLIQTASYGTIFLVSFWIALINLILALIIARKYPVADREHLPRRQYQLAWSLWIALLIVSLATYMQVPVGKEMMVAAVQPGVDMAFGDRDTRSARLAVSLRSLTEQAANEGAELIVLPEGVGDASQMPPQLPFAPGDVPIVFGARRGVDPMYQSAFGYDGTYKWADKSRLVIFGEFVPGRSVFPFIATAFLLPTGDMSSGPNGTETFDLAGNRIGPVICFEGLFPDIAIKQALNGAQILTVVSIDDWYMGTPAPDQLRSASIFRAIEARRPLIRSASLGYTMIVDSRGRVIKEVPLAEPGIAMANITVPTERSGPFPFIAVFPIASVIILFGFGFLPPRRKESGPERVS